MKNSTKMLLAAGFTIVAAGSIIATNSSLARDGHFRTAATTGGPTGDLGAQSANQFRRAHFRQGGMRRGMRRGRRGGRLFETFDTNDDGILTQAEVDKTRQDQFDKFDANKDGKLSLKEYETLWLDAMRKRMVDRFQSHDDDGDAAVTLDEFQSRLSRVVRRLDDDGDGKVTRQELRDRRSGKHHRKQ